MLKIIKIISQHFLNFFHFIICIILDKLYPRIKKVNSVSEKGLLLKVFPKSLFVLVIFSLILLYFLDL